MTFIIQQILPHYRYDVLKYLPENKFKILYSNTVKEGSLKSVETDKDNFINIPIIKIGEKYFQFPFFQILKYKPDFVVVTPELRNLSFWILFCISIILRFQLVSWTHGINNKDYYTGKISFSGRLRIIMIKLSDQVITYSKNRAQLLSAFIDSKITVANNTLDTVSINEVYTLLSGKEKKSVYKKLGWSDSEIHFIYVGRLIREKNIVESLSLFKKVFDRVDKKCNFHIVGEGPYKSQLVDFVKEKKLQNIHFHGQILDSEVLGAMLYASDLHLHLGYTGLAVVHSLCFGCPVVTQIPVKIEGPFHSPEFEYLSNENSILGLKEDLAEKVIQSISDPSRSELLKQNARYTFENRCSIDHFLQAFKDLESDK